MDLLFLISRFRMWNIHSLFYHVCENSLNLNRH